MFKSKVSESGSNSEDIDFFGVLRSARTIREGKLFSFKLIREERRKLKEERIRLEREKQAIDNSKLSLKKVEQSVISARKRIKVSQKIERTKNLRVLKKLEDERKKISTEKYEILQKKKDIEKIKKDGDKQIKKLIMHRKLCEKSIQKAKEEKQQLQIIKEEEEEKEIERKFKALEIEYFDLITEHCELKSKLKKNRVDFRKELIRIKRIGKKNKLDGMMNNESSSLLIDYEKTFILNHEDPLRMFPMSEKAFSNLVRHPKFNFGKVYREEVDSDGKKRILKFDILVYACYYGYYREIKFLLSKCNPSRFNHRSVKEASSGSDIPEDDPFGRYGKTVQILLLDERVDPSKSNQHCLFNSCYSGHFQIVKLLLSDERVCPSDQIFLNAVFMKHRNIVEYLLFVDRRIKNTMINFFLKQCVMEGNHSCLEVILKDPRANPSCKDNEPFILAINRKNFGNDQKRIIQLLVFHEKFTLNFDQAIEICREYKKYPQRDHLKRLRSIHAKKIRKENLFKKNVVALSNEFKEINISVIHHILGEICGGNDNIARETLKTITKETSNEIMKIIIKKNLPILNLNDLNITETLEEVENEENNVGDITMNLENLRRGFECPITTMLMEFPVILVESGQTYERAAITEWLRHNDSDPLTRKHLNSKLLIDNIVLRNQIEEWKKIKGEDK